MAELPVSYKEDLLNILKNGDKNELAKFISAKIEPRLINAINCYSSLFPFINKKSFDLVSFTQYTELVKTNLPEIFVFYFMYMFTLNNDITPANVVSQSMSLGNFVFTNGDYSYGNNPDGNAILILISDVEDLISKLKAIIRIIDVRGVVFKCRDSIEGSYIFQPLFNDNIGRTCDYCLTNHATMKCSNCKISLYCSKECQKLFWKKCHKKLCFRSDSDCETMLKLIVLLLFRTTRLM